MVVSYTLLKNKQRIKKKSREKFHNLSEKEKSTK